jgi:hypothetical protein
VRHYVRDVFFFYFCGGIIIKILALLGYVSHTFYTHFVAKEVQERRGEEERGEKRRGEERREKETTHLKSDRLLGTVVSLL